MEFNEEDLDFFVEKIYDKNLFVAGSMCSVDMFSLHYALKKIKPKIVIESGVFHGASTQLIRKTVGDNIKIISIDPLKLPKNGWRDKNPNTTYYLGKNFVDFKDLNLEKYNSNEIFAYFDDHQNIASRIVQCINKNIKYLLFNDNYPKNCGSHFTMEHLLNNDLRNIGKDAKQIKNINNDVNFKNYDKKKKEILANIDIYHIFPKYL